MIVAVVAVLVMQVAADQVIGVVAVGNRLMAAVGAVLVAALVFSAAMIRRAAFGIAVADADAVFVYVVAMHVMQVAVVQIIDVTVVAHRGVPAVGAVGVRMTFMGVVFLRHVS